MSRLIDWGSQWSADTTSRMSVVTIAAASVVTSVLMLAPGLFHGPSPDAGVFATSGWLMAHDGWVPFRDIWDHKPPGLFAAAWLAQMVVIVGDPWTKLWLLSTAATATASTVVGLLAAQRWGAAPGVLVAIILATMAGAFPFALGGGLSENLALPFAALAFFIATRQPARPAAWACIGSLAVIGVVTTLQLVAIGPALLWLALHDGGRAGLTRVAALGFGAVVVLCLSVMGIGAAGALPHAVDQLIGYNAVYLQLGAGSDADTALDAMLRLLPVALLAVGGWFMADRARTPSPALIASWLWITTGIVLVVLQSRFFAHYLIPLSIPLAIVAAPGLAYLQFRVHRGSGLAAAAIALWGAVLTAPALYDSGAYLGYGRQAIARAVTAAVTDAAPTARTAFVWGLEPELYVSMGLKPVGPYLYAMPLTTPGYSDERRVDALLAVFRRSPPEVIIDAGSSAPGREGMVPLLEPRPVRAAGGRTLDVIDELRSFLREHYRHERTVAGWPIYLHASATGDEAHRAD